MPTKLQKKTKALWVEMFEFLQEPRTSGDVQEQFNLSRQQVYEHYNNMQNNGFNLRRRRAKLNGTRVMFRWLELPLLDALVKLTRDEDIKIREPAKEEEKQKKQEPAKAVARDVSEGSRGSAPPWFVLTSQCQAMYQGQSTVQERA